MNTRVLYIPLFIYLLVGIWVTFMLINLHFQFFLMLFSVLWNMNLQIECWVMLILCYFLHQPNNLLQLWASGAMRSWLLGWSLSLLSFVCILYSLHLILWDLSILYTFLLPKVFYFLFWLIFYSFLLLLGIYFYLIGGIVCSWIWTAIWALFISLESLLPPLFPV